MILPHDSATFSMKLSCVWLNSNKERQEEKEQVGETDNGPSGHD